MAWSFEGVMLRLVERIALILRRYRSIGDREATYLMACDRRESKMDSVPFEIMPTPARCSKKQCRTHFSKLFPRGPKPRDQAFATWAFGGCLPRSQLPLLWHYWLASTWLCSWKNQGAVQERRSSSLRKRYAYKAWRESRAKAFFFVFLWEIIKPYSTPSLRNNYHLNLHKTM